LVIFFFNLIGGVFSLAQQIKTKTKTYKLCNRKQNKMKYEDKPVQKENFLPPRKRHIYEQQQKLLHPEAFDSEEKKTIKVEEPVKLFKKVENSHIHQQIQKDYNQVQHYSAYLKTYSQEESFEEEEVVSLIFLSLRKMKMTKNYIVFVRKGIIQTYG
jgi:hypothetical protein